MWIICHTQGFNTLNMNKYSGSIQTCQEAYLGVDDWVHPEWPGMFYPDDMPVEWQLAYYNTQFGCLWLDHARWAAATAAEATRWMQDTHEDFRFVLELPRQPDAFPEEILAILKPRIGALCHSDDPSLIWFDAQTDLRDLTGWIGRRQATGKFIYLLSRDGNLAGLERARTLLRLLGL